MLVAGTTLPLILFAGAIVYQNYEKDRQEAETRVVETVRSVRIVLDAELQRMVGALRVLTSTNSLQSGDFVRFRRVASGFLEQYEDSALLVSDRDGRQLFSSVIEDTTGLPPRTSLETMRKVFDTGRPAFSDLFAGTVLQRPVITVEVPAFRDGEVVYDISFAPPLSLFQKIIQEQRPGDAWTISIFDSKGINFARLPNPQDTIGKRASPTLYAVLFQSREGKQRGVSLEGVPLITAFSRSNVADWTVAGGIAESTLVRPLWRNLAITAAAGLLLLLIGVGFAVRMAAAIARGEALHELLVQELNHRVKNTLAIMQAIASQTFRTATAEERRTFDGRLGALSAAHNLLSEEKWVGAKVRDVVERVMQPYVVMDADTDRITLSGPDLPLSAPRAVAMSMILHEIATNAAKYGALSNDNGEVAIAWGIFRVPSGEMLRLTWRERGGPPVHAPDRKGFGTRLIERSSKDQLGGKAEVTYAEGGVSYVIECVVG